MGKVIGINKASRSGQTIYDPTCGSGSLLLKAADESGAGVTIYGQEMDNATAGLAKMNMIQHDNPTAEIWRDNSLEEPSQLYGRYRCLVDRNVMHGSFHMEYPFLELPNVLGSPHNSGVVPHVLMDATRQAAENIKHFLKGEKVMGIAQRKDYQW